MKPFGLIEAGDVFDVRLPDDHHVAAHRPVVVDDDGKTLVFERDLELVKICAQ